MSIISAAVRQIVTHKLKHSGLLESKLRSHLTRPTSCLLCHSSGITSRTLKRCRGPSYQFVRCIQVVVNSYEMPEKKFERLPKDVVPKNYNIRLQPDIEKFTFVGSEEVEVEVIISPVCNVGHVLQIVYCFPFVRVIFEKTHRVLPHFFCIGTTDYGLNKSFVLIFSTFFWGEGGPMGIAGSSPKKLQPATNLSK